jgi:hypothetical protein
MTSEVETIIAFLFKRSGKEELTPSDLYLPLSMDLQWFTPNQAKTFVNMALQQKLLIKKEGKLKPSFDYEKIVVPVGFRPSKKPIEEKEVKEEKLDAVKTIINRIVEKTGLDEKSVIEKIKDVEKEKNVRPEVAALLVGKEYDVDVDDCFDEIEEKLFRENKE